MLAIPSRVIATCFALVSFAAAALAGAAAGNRLETVLVRALGVMLVAWIVGMVLGAIAQRTVDEHIEAYKQAHPIPSDDITELDEQPDSAMAEQPQHIAEVAQAADAVAETRATPAPDRDYAPTTSNGQTPRRTAPIAGRRATPQTQAA